MTNSFCGLVEWNCLRSLGSLFNHLLLSLCALGIGALSIHGQTASPPRSATQIWAEQQIAFPVSQRVDLVLLGYEHFGRKSERPVAEHAATGLGASFKVGKHLTLFPFYTHFENQPVVLSRNKEERLTIEATLKFPFHSVTLSDRNRFEYHWKTPHLDFIHYRNRLQFEHSLNLAGLSGFVADEVFYDTHFDAWIRNRIYAGVSKKVNEHVSFELYYMRQSDGHSRPGDLNVVGNTLKIRL